jgi:hypothetical protein
MIGIIAGVTMAIMVEDMNRGLAMQMIEDMTRNLVIHTAEAAEGTCMAKDTMIAADPATGRMMNVMRRGLVILSHRSGDARR